MYIAGRKHYINRIAQRINYRMDFRISAAASNPNALILLMPTDISMTFGGTFRGFRLSLFLHLHLLCAL